MTNNDFLNVNELKKYTTLSHKQIRNNLNNLKKVPVYNNLIKGGGKGRGGQFWFHYSLIPHITIRQRNNKKVRNQTTLKFRNWSSFFYAKTSWDYFGCIHPNRDTDFIELINSLNNFVSFYVIHRRNEIHHIHFTIQSPLKKDEIKDLLRSYFLKKNISIDKVFLTGFVKEFRDDTINYLLRKGQHSSKHDLIDWGCNYPLL